MLIFRIKRLFKFYRFILCFIIIFFISFLVFENLEKDSFKKKFVLRKSHHKHHRNHGRKQLKIIDSIKKSKCNIPIDLNPWDPTVMPFINKTKDFIECPNKWPMKGSVDPNGILSFTGDLRGVECYYSEFYKPQFEDQQVKYEKEKQFDPLLGLFLEELSIKFLNVTCFKQSVKVYSFMFAYPSGLRYEPNGQDQASFKPSVIIMVIESMSRMSYLRSLPKTNAAFESLRNVFHFKGMSKLGLHTLSNMVPLTMGRIKMND